MFEDFHKGFHSGVQYFFQGWRLLGEPAIRPFVIVPFFINLVVFVLLITLTWHEFDRLNAWLLNLLPHWLQWLTWLIWPIFFITLLGVIFYTFTMVANVLAAPFNGFLAEKVEKHLCGGLLTESSGFTAFLKEIPLALGRECQKLLYYLPRALGLLILFFIPLVSIAAAVFWFLFNAWMMTLQYGDYPMENHRIPFKKTRQQSADERGVALGFGIAVLIASMIPIVNFLVMPAAVCGGTAMWVDCFRPGHKGNQPHFP